MIKKPLVSIVIPIYNQHESFLRECIESAINQTYSNIEILISDNHSINGSSEIIASYAQTDRRIRIVKPQQFLSMMENFIFAYNNANGEYICPLSSDDILYPEIVEEHLKPFYTYPELSFSYSVPLYFSADINKGKWIPSKLNSGFYSSGTFLALYVKHRTRYCTWGAILFKTTSYYKIGGFPKEFHFAADVDAIIKLILLNGGVYCINKPLCAIRQWEREEHNTRTPDVLRDIAKIYDTIESEGLTNKISLHPKIAKKAKKIFFLNQVLAIPYFLQCNRRTPEIIEKTIAVIKENYPNGIFNFAIANRKNKVGLVLSVVSLSFMRVKSWFR